MKKTQAVIVSASLSKERIRLPLRPIVNNIRHNIVVLEGAEVNALLCKNHFEVSLTDFFSVLILSAIRIEATGCQSGFVLTLGAIFIPPKVQLPGFYAVYTNGPVRPHPAPNSDLVTGLRITIYPGIRSYVQWQIIELPT